MSEAKLSEAKLSEAKLSDALAAAGEALARGEAEEALSLAEAAAEREGGSADGELLRGRALLALGRLAEARNAAKACLKRRLGDEGALALLDAIDEALEAVAELEVVPSGNALPPRPGPSPGPFDVGAEILREYTVEKRLGEGGMGVVYQARSSGGQRFAVKAIAARSLADEAHRQAFLRELSTWLSLPAHPHLAACRFFRTVGDQIAIFAELVDGGSLDAWVGERRIARLEQVVDVAVQAAWGLSAAHRAGAVHQDVKPSNLLLTRGGLVKVSDFGLARARPRASGSGPAEGELLVARAGLSEAYCSPEQARGEGLSARSDVFSLGVTVLEMLLGRPPCRFGPDAPRVLEALRLGREEARFALPPALDRVLSRCLRTDPAERWASMDELSDALASAHLELFGHSYPRRPPGQAGQPGQAGGPVEQVERSVGGLRWADPRRFLDEGDEEALGPGSGPLSAIPGSSRNQLVASDLAVLERAALSREQRLARRADSEGAALELAEIYKEKAFVHQAAHDLYGAIACYERAAALLSPWVEAGREELVRPFGVYLLNAGACRRAAGEVGAAMAFQSRAIELWSERVERGGRADLREALAAALHNQSTFLRDSGDRASIATADRAIALWEALVEAGDEAAAGRLAATLDGKALALRDWGDLAGALACHRRALDLFSSLAERGVGEARNDVAMVSMNMAMTLRESGELDASLEQTRRAVAIRRQMVEVEGRRELLEDLALAHASCAAALGSLGQVREQLAENNQAVAIWEQLVHQEGRADLAHGLALAYTTLAEALRNDGEPLAAVDANRRALAMWQRICAQEPRAEHDVSRLKTHINLAIALNEAGDPAGAERAAGEAVGWAEARADRADAFAGLAAWAKVARAEARLALGDEAGAADDVAQALVVLPIEAARTGRAELALAYEHALERLAPRLSLR